MEFRLRGRPRWSTVASVGQTMRWAVSANAVATTPRSLKVGSSRDRLTADCAPVDPALGWCGVRPYSTDLRERVLAAVDAGARREEVAAVFGVSVPTIKRYLKRRRETRGLVPTAHPGRPAPKGDALAAWLPAQLERRNDATLEEHCAAFAAEAGVAVSTATMSRAIARLPGGWRLKKRR